MLYTEILCRASCIHYDNLLFQLLYQCIVHPVDAIITVGPVDTPSLINGDVTLTCTASGIPLPSVMWLDQDSGIVVPATDVIINVTTIMSTLTLTSLQVNDFGYYECTATNMFDSEAEKAFLGGNYHIHFITTCHCTSSPSSPT